MYKKASISVRNDGYHHQHQNSGQNHQPQHIIKNNDTYSVVNKNNAANINNSNNSHSSVNQQYHHPIRKASSHRDIDHIERETVSAIRNQIRTSEGAARQEHINRLDSLKQQLVDLERQYEKGKPLVNLVDNMVKLGSLYKSGSKGSNLALNEKPLADNNTSDRLEFNQRVQEQRMLEEERRNWDRLSPNHNELQSKVQQLYQLDQLLQEESGTLQSLQRDKENLERALGGLRARLQTGSGPPMAIEAARKQQHALERELSRVHQLLAENSKVEQKLEQTVAGNARLEQELSVLRQKLQASRGSKGSLNGLASSGGGQGGAPDSVSYAGSASAVLESELRRVQQLVGDMQRQRQELSQAVRQLTENSDSLYQQIKPADQYQPSHIKKRTHSTSWMETDLDTSSSTSHSDYIKSPELSTTKPLFVDTGSTDQMKMSQYQRAQMEQESSGVESSDDLLEGPNFQGLSYQEKQEIKTVRIVKRESERRQRDRERTNSTSQNLDQVQEEEYFVDDFRDLQQNRPYLDTFEQFNQIKAPSKNTNPFLDTSPYSYQPPPSMNQQNNENYYSGQMLDANYVNYDYQRAQSGLKSKTESIQSLTKTIGDLSPVFQSEAARQIIYEMSGNTSEDNSDGKIPLSNKHRRAVPKEKRRHNTAPNNVMSKSVQPAQSENDMNKPNTNWRARDDLDMEVALRPRINAPDVVRSALGDGGNRDKVSENAIDKLFAAPSKIVIPERYIPEQLPELSPEEKKKRQEKVEAIKKMLSEAPINASNDNGPPSGQISAEKKQREHLLQLNQILAQQVMQMSKIVAGNPIHSNQNK